MRSACWLIFVSALCANSLACDTNDPGHKNSSDADADGGRRDAAATRRSPRDLDGSVRPDVEPDAQSLPMDAGPDVGPPDVGPPDVGPPEKRGGEADLDGGVDPGGEGIRYAGGDGSSCEQAVVILGAKGEFDGARAEYDWLHDHYPGADVLEQALGLCNDDWTDILSIRTASGKTLEVYFDIDAFFGT